MSSGPRLAVSTMGVLVALLSAAACAPVAGPPDGVGDAVENRAGLTVIPFRSEVTNGPSSDLRFRIPERAQSVLIEVQGSNHLFSLAELSPPSGRDMVEGGTISTR